MDTINKSGYQFDNLDTNYKLFRHRYKYFGINKDYKNKCFFKVHVF